MRSARRFFLTFTPARRVRLCPHNLRLDQAGECPKCEAKRRARSLLRKLRRLE